MRKKFIPGQTYVPTSGKVYDREEIDNAIAAARDEWWTEGRFAKKFERDFKKFLGVKHVSIVNSGSSANLLATAALTSKVFGKRRLKRGDEFITTPVAFPTTVNPSLLYGLKPVFVDADLNTLNIDASQIERAITKKTRLIVMAHTLGMPFNLDVVMRLVRKYKLWLIEDCCDALGTKYKRRLVGTFGHIATFSFYPAHQMTMGEGGAIVTDNPKIHRSIRQFRDWGRDCWCNTGRDNTCGNRFRWQLGGLPFGYDHKYTYSQIGYNFKVSDFQPAIGVAQLKKLPSFIEKRKKTYKKYYVFFKQYEQYFKLLKTTEKEDSCWFGFTLIVRAEAPFTRAEFTGYLEDHNVGTRTVFSGNLLKHPAYTNLKYRSIGAMTNSDTIMDRAFWIGVYPGIGDTQINYVKKTVKKFLSRYS